jgi:hypothetical protein
LCAFTARIQRGDRAAPTLCGAFRVIRLIFPTVAANAFLIDSPSSRRRVARIKKAARFAPGGFFASVLPASFLALMEEGASPISLSIHQAAFGVFGLPIIRVM